jgi:hypothetical protein
MLPRDFMLCYFHEQQVCIQAACIWFVLLFTVSSHVSYVSLLCTHN